MREMQRNLWRFSRMRQNLRSQSQMITLTSFICATSLVKLAKINCQSRMNYTFSTCWLSQKTTKRRKFLPWTKANYKTPSASLVKRI